MHKILILGSLGMLGQALTKIFNCDKNYEVIAWDKNDLDITNEMKVSEALKNVKCDFIINAAAYTDVDGAETNQGLAFKVNADAVKYLSETSLARGVFFIHISTDYVFDGENIEGYREINVSEKSLNAYGESKRLGEKYVLEVGTKGLDYYLIRTSWLFGLGGKNFVDTMIDLAQEKKELSIVNDQHGKPTYVNDLVATIKYMIESNLSPGVYHFTNEPDLTWYDFARIIFETKKEIDPNFIVPKIIPVPSSDFPRPAKRPSYSILQNNKLPKGRNIKNALKEYLQ